MADGPAQPGVSTQQEQLQARHVGMGHARMTQHEWAVNQHRDSIATYVGRHHMMEYMALARGVSVGRVKWELLQRYARPCGAEPKKRKLDQLYGEHGAE